MPTVIVQAYRTGLPYVDHEGVRYESDDLPSEGTEVEIETFTGIGDVPGADFTWSAESPSGRGFARATGWWL